VTSSTRAPGQAAGLLVIDDVHQQFGALQVLTGITLEIPAGQAVGLVGPNGAGKTTLLDIVAGDRRPGRGRVRLAGRDVSAASPASRTRLGLGRTYQVPRPFGSMTVFENALVGAVRGAGLRSHAATGAAYAALQRAGLAGKANVPARDLTLLDRKRLELARALATQPSVLLLDEIAGGLTEPETQVLIGTIRAVHAAGVTIVWVEHIMRALTQVVQRAVCLAYGQVLFDGTPEQMLADSGVQRAYLGGAPW
jgi:branched-chain amino acid transport system ATP-binding protein